MRNEHRPDIVSVVDLRILMPTNLNQTVTRLDHPTGRGG